MAATAGTLAGGVAVAGEFVGAAGDDDEACFEKAVDAKAAALSSPPCRGGDAALEAAGVRGEEGGGAGRAAAVAARGDTSGARAVRTGDESPAGGVGAAPRGASR